MTDEWPKVYKIPLPAEIRVVVHPSSEHPGKFCSTLHTGTTFDATDPGMPFSGGVRDVLAEEPTRIDVATMMGGWVAHEISEFLGFDPHSLDGAAPCVIDPIVLRRSIERHRKRATRLRAMARELLELVGDASDPNTSARLERYRKEIG